MQPARISVGNFITEVAIELKKVNEMLFTCENLLTPTFLFDHIHINPN